MLSFARNIRLQQTEHCTAIEPSRTLKLHTSIDDIHIIDKLPFFFPGHVFQEERWSKKTGKKRMSISTKVKQSLNKPEARKAIYWSSQEKQ